MKPHLLTLRLLGPRTAVVGRALLLIASIQAVGLVALAWITRVPPTLINISGTLAAVGLALMFISRGSALSTRAKLATPLVAAALVAAVASRPALLPMHVVRHHGAPLDRRYAPNHTRTICVRGRCVTSTTNSLGFRGAEPRARSALTPRVVFVGDSHVFGYGVGDQETIPARLEARAALARRPLDVLNAGVEGAAVGAMTQVTALASRLVDADLVVVLLKDDDLLLPDMQGRVQQLSTSFAARMRFWLNLDLPRDAWAVARFTHRSHGPSAEQATEAMQQLAQAAEGRTLLIVTLLDNEAREGVRTWTARARRVVWHGGEFDPAFQHAERIVGDGHWSARGCDAIAAALLPQVYRALDEARVAAPGVPR